MATSILLPDHLEAVLQQYAAGQQRSVEEVALDILNDALDTMSPAPSVDDVVATIQATPPNLHNIRPARGSLADALRNSPNDPEFDLTQWNADWAAVEAEMRAMTRANDEVETQ